MTVPVADIEAWPHALAEQPVPSLPQAAPDSLPVIIDLDGTLTATDTLHEAYFQALLRRPLTALAALAALRDGRAAFKRKTAELRRRDCGTIPLRADLIAYLHILRADGASLHLVTAADQSTADEIARVTGLFDSATGSDGRKNLGGEVKLLYLKERFPDGFIYAGDSGADLQIWKRAEGAILAGNSSLKYERPLRAAGVPIVARFPDPGFSISSWLRLFRIHQWSKNLLFFIPLFLSGAFLEPAPLLMSILGFVLLGLVASGTYVINDIADLESDRRHRSKCARPIASGAIGVTPAFAAAVLMIIGGLIAASLLSPPFALVLIGYVALTLSYSLLLKQIPMLDVAIIATLFTSRIFAGSILLSLPHSPWLTPFSLLIFLSLALAKRHCELVTTPSEGKLLTNGRGYRSNDTAMTLALGMATGLAAIVVLLLYIGLEVPALGIYPQSAWLYLAPAAVLIWVMRIWLLSSRGELHDDPVVFAVKDRISWMLGSIIILGFALAA